MVTGMLRWCVTWGVLSEFMYESVEAICIQYLLGDTMWHQEACHINLPWLPHNLASKSVSPDLDDG